MQKKTLKTDPKNEARNHQFPAVSAGKMEAHTAKTRHQKVHRFFAFCTNKLQILKKL